MIAAGVSSLRDPMALCQEAYEQSDAIAEDKGEA